MKAAISTSVLLALTALPVTASTTSAQEPFAVCKQKLFKALGGRVPLAGIRSLSDQKSCNHRPGVVFEYYHTLQGGVHGVEGRLAYACCFPDEGFKIERAVQISD